MIELPLRVGEHDDRDRVAEHEDRVEEHLAKLLRNLLPKPPRGKKKKKKKKRSGGGGVCEQFNAE